MKLEALTPELTDELRRMKILDSVRLPVDVAEQEVAMQLQHLEEPGQHPEWSPKGGPPEWEERRREARAIARCIAHEITRQRNSQIRDFQGLPDGLAALRDALTDIAQGSGAQAAAWIEELRRQGRITRRWMALLVLLAGLIVFGAGHLHADSKIYTITVTDGSHTNTAAVPFSMTFSGCTVGGTPAAQTITCNTGTNNPGGSSNQVQYNNGGSTFGGIGNGSAGQVLESNGSGGLPSFQDPIVSLNYVNLLNTAAATATVSSAAPVRVRLGNSICWMAPATRSVQLPGRLTSLSRVRLRSRVVSATTAPRHRAIGLARFPKGCMIAHVGDLVLDVRPAKLTEEWTWCGTESRVGLNPPGVGDPALPVQERINDMVNIIHEYMDRLSCGILLANESLLDSKALNGKALLPGVINGITFKKGQQAAIAEAIMQIKAEMDAQIYAYVQASKFDMQLLVGTPPQIFGGAGDPHIETRGGQEQQLQTAMGKLGLFWDNIREEAAEAAQLAVRCQARNMTDDLLSVITDETRELRNRYVRLEEMRGNFHAEPETDQGFPMTYAEIKAFYEDLMNTSESVFTQALFAEPTNVDNAVRYVGVPGLVAPGTAMRQKVLRVIDQLMSGAPVEQNLNGIAVIRAREEALNRQQREQESRASLESLNRVAGKTTERTNKLLAPALEKAGLAGFSRDAAEKAIGSRLVEKLGNHQLYMAGRRGILSRPPGEQREKDLLAHDMKYINQFLGPIAAQVIREATAGPLKAQETRQQKVSGQIAASRTEPRGMSVNAAPPSHLDPRAFKARMQEEYRSSHGGEEMPPELLFSKVLERSGR